MEIKILEIFTCVLLITTIATTVTGDIGYSEISKESPDSFYDINQKFFNYETESWLEYNKLVALDGADHDNFGWSVDIDGNYAIIGAPDDDDSLYTR